MPKIRVNNVVIDPSEVVFARFHPDGYDNSPAPGLLVRFKSLVEVFHGEEARRLWAFLGAAPEIVSPPSIEPLKPAPSDSASDSDFGLVGLGQTATDDDSYFRRAVVRYARSVGRFSGTVQDLLDELRESSGWTSTCVTDFPASPKGLSIHLRRSIDLFDRSGVVVRFRPRSGRGRRVDLFWLPVGDRRSDPNQPPTG